jgi:hypothetical protein
MMISARGKAEMVRHKLVSFAAWLVLFALPAGAAMAQVKSIVGNTVHGHEDDGEFYDYYAPNGAVTSRLVGGDTTHGRWSVQNGNMCLSFPDDQPACYRVSLSGASGTMTDVSSGVVFSIQIIRGNAGP